MCPLEAGALECRCVHWKQVHWSVDVSTGSRSTGVQTVSTGSRSTGVQTVSTGSRSTGVQTVSTGSRSTGVQTVSTGSRSTGVQMCPSTLMAQPNFVICCITNPIDTDVHLLAMQVL
jgi:hypothetical protein